MRTAARRRSAGRIGGRRAPAGRGAMLVEMLVALLLMAVAVSALAGAMLQGTSQGARLQRKELGSLQVNRLLQDLKNYVTADFTAAGAPGGCWDFVNPATGTCVPTCGSCGLTWALADGTHNVTFLLPADLSAAPVSAQLTYTVSSAGGRPDVTARMDWSEP